MTIDTYTISSMQRSLRQCLSHMAAMLYHHGYGLEAVSVPHRGLHHSEVARIASTDREWQICESTLINSEAAAWNKHSRLVLTPMGRALLFDMFGEGAADCA